MYEEPKPYGSSKCNKCKIVVLNTNEYAVSGQLNGETRLCMEPISLQCHGCDATDAWLDQIPYHPDPER